MCLHSCKYLIVAKRKRCMIDQPAILQPHNLRTNTQYNPCKRASGFVAHVCYVRFAK